MIRFPNRCPVPMEIPSVEILIDQVANLCRGKRFGDIIGGAALDGLHGAVDGCIGGHDHHHKIRRISKQFGNEIETA